MSISPWKMRQRENEGLRQLRVHRSSLGRIHRRLSAWNINYNPNLVVGGSAGAPVVLYTDIISGPNTGGENNKGIYLSIFGFNFGNSGLGTTLKVLIGGVEVDNYRSLGVSKGRPDIQQITVQIGAIGNPTPGVNLPVVVQKSGVNSNSNLNFMVNPGKIFFVDNLVGSDSTGVHDDIAHPYRTVQTSNLAQGVWGQVQAGDFMVMRGNNGNPWTDVGFEGYFCRWRDKSGSAPTGSVGTGHITIMGYPGEDVYIYNLKSAGFNGSISGINGSSFPGMGQYGCVSNLRIEGSGDDGAVDIEIYGHGWRCVNNNLTCTFASTAARAGGFAGNGNNVVVYGNYIHEIDSPDPGLENHGVYIDNDGSYDVAYNYIYNVNDGNGLQTYTYGFLATPQYTQNVVFHHNWIQNVQKHGLNIGDGTKAGVVIYNNVIQHCQDAGLRFNTQDLSGCKIYHNTFYISNLYGNSAYGMIMNDWNLPAGTALDLQNNIFVPKAIGQTPDANSAYNVGAIAGSGTIKNNLWFNGNGAVSTDTAPVSGDPKFTNPAVDFRPLVGSAAINAGATGLSGTVKDDYFFQSRPRAGSTKPTIGAFE